MNKFYGAIILLIGLLVIMTGCGTTSDSGKTADSNEDEKKVVTADSNKEEEQEATADNNKEEEQEATTDDKVDTTQEETTDETSSDEVTLTYDELEAYDGTNGMPAYIAVDGIIYDVSESSKWQEGKHNGFTAGQDLSDEIKEVSPHGISVLERLPEVGKIVE